jgi:hypothetical protein
MNLILYIYYMIKINIIITPNLRKMGQSFFINKI